MKITSSYGMEIKHMNKIFQPTVTIYNQAVSFCVDAFEQEWTELDALDVKTRKQRAENLIHTTKQNRAKYGDFDTRFYKMPSYMRRAAINAALGYLSAYHSNLENWEENGCQGKKPSFQRHLNRFPTFYRGGSYRQGDRDAVRLKIYRDNDWKWVTVVLKHTDMQYLRKHFNGVKMSSPTLEKQHHKWFLRFAFEESVTLTDSRDTVLAVDLGINTDATCSVMGKDGTVLARKFINFASEKDQLTHTLNKIKGVSQKSGSHNTTKLWRYARLKNEELARKTAKAITDYAAEQHVDVIVFEYLDMQGKKCGSKKQKLHMWKKNAIQNLAAHKAHRTGIRIARVCAKNTSKLACDGSGGVLRGKDGGFNTHELCKFRNGKIYNCDLSASYNIGARYFIRELKKSTSEKEWSRMQAKVPACEKRTQCTYHTFRELLKAV